MSEARTFEAVPAGRPDRDMFDATVWRIDVSPLETKTPTGSRIQLGFPALYVPVIVNDAEAFAVRVAKVLTEHFSVDPSQAIADVIAERRRQVTEEGFTSADDDGYAPGTLSAAATCYAMHATETLEDDQFAPCCPPPKWPWAREWWKPNGVRRALVKAAALIIAEIEKIDRNASKTPAVVLEVVK